MGIKRFIEVSFQKEGVHKYPAAEGIPGIEFLSHPHRHMFYFYVKLEVYHEDREVEFIMFKRWLESLYAMNCLDIDYMSCEMLAEQLVNIIKDSYSGRELIVRVYEDDENGAVIEYKPD